MVLGATIFLIFLLAAIFAGQISTHVPTRLNPPLRLKPRRLVELATIEGAKLLGLADKTGSLTPGKRADLIMIRTTDLNMVPARDPYYAIVFTGSRRMSTPSWSMAASSSAAASSLPSTSPS